MWPLPACYGCNGIDGGICWRQFFDVGRPIVKVHFANLCDTLSLDANFRLVKLAICVRLTVVLTCWLLFRVIKGHENVSFSCPVTLQFNRFVICSCNLVSFLANLQTRMVKHQTQWPKLATKRKKIFGKNLTIPFKSLRKRLMEKRCYLRGCNDSSG